MRLRSGDCHEEFTLRPRPAGGFVRADHGGLFRAPRESGPFRTFCPPIAPLNTPTWWQPGLTPPCTILRTCNFRRKTFASYVACRHSARFPIAGVRLDSGDLLEISRGEREDDRRSLEREGKRLTRLDSSQSTVSHVSAVTKFQTTMTPNRSAMPVAWTTPSQSTDTSLQSLFIHALAVWANRTAASIIT